MQDSVCMQHPAREGSAWLLLAKPGRSNAAGCPTPRAPQAADGRHVVAALGQTVFRRAASIDSDLQVGGILVAVLLQSVRQDA